MRWYRKSRSEYDFEADSTAGRCGRPAPTTISGAPVWDSSWQAAHSAETSSGPQSCISSMNRAMPVPTSVATLAASVNSSTRSISMSPESARPIAAGTSMPGCQRSRSLVGLPGGHPQRERLQYAEKLVDPIGRPVVRGQLADGHVQRGRDRPAQRLVGPRLDLAGAPQAGDGLRPQRVEQHGLADAAQAGEDERALGPAARDPLEDDLEHLQLAVSAGQLGWALTGAGRIGIANRIHDLDRIGLSSASRRTG